MSKLYESHLASNDNHHHGEAIAISGSMGLVDMAQLKLKLW